MWQAWLTVGGRKEPGIWESNLQINAYTLQHTLTHKHIHTRTHTRAESVLSFRPSHLILSLDSSMASKCLLTINRFVDLGLKHHPNGTHHPFIKLWLVFSEASVYMRTYGTTWWLNWKAVMTGKSARNADEMLVVFVNHSENIVEDQVSLRSS